MARSGILRVRIEGDDSPLRRTLGGTVGKVGKFAAAAGAAAVAAIGVVGVKGVQAAREANRINRITEQVIKSTGGAANVSAKQVDDLSGRLQKLTGVSDETIQRGSNMLLTFTNIRNEVGKGNDIFDQATGLALDMSVAMGQDVKQSAIQLGKALNDPIKGVGALSRVGVQFTDQQKEQIRVLVESGDVMGAQKVILAELGKEFGGTAEAAADPIQKLMSTLGDMVELIGQAVLPVVDVLATWLAQVLPPAVAATLAWFRQLGDWWAANSPAIIAFAQQLWQGISAAFTAIANVVRTAIGVVRNVIDGVRQTLDANRERVQGWRETIATIFGQIRDTIRSIFATIRTLFKVYLNILTEFWNRFGKHLVDYLVRTVSRIIDTVRGVFQVLKGIFDLIRAVLTGQWGKAWDAIKSILAGAWRVIRNLIGQLWDAIKTAFGAGVAAISQVWSFLWDQAKKLLRGAWDAIVRTIRERIADAREVFDSIVSFITTLPGKIARAASGMWDGITDAFKGAINAIIRVWNGLSFTLPSVHGDWNGPLPGGAFSVGGWTLSTPNLPYFQRGGIVVGPTLAMIGEGRNREAVLPLNERTFDELGRAIARHIGGDRGGVTIQLLGPVTEEVTGRAAALALRVAT